MANKKNSLIKKDIEFMLNHFGCDCLRNKNNINSSNDVADLVTKWLKKNKRRALNMLKKAHFKDKI